MYASIHRYLGACIFIHRCTHTYIHTHRHIYIYIRTYICTWYGVGGLIPYWHSNRTRWVRLPGTGVFAGLRARIRRGSKYQYDEYSRFFVMHSPEGPEAPPYMEYLVWFWALIPYWRSEWTLWVTGSMYCYGISLGSLRLLQCHELRLRAWRIMFLRVFGHVYLQWQLPVWKQAFGRQLSNPNSELPKTSDTISTPASPGNAAR